MTSPRPPSRSLMGNSLQLGAYEELKSHGIQISRPCVDASIVVGAENTNVRTITIQLKDAEGRDIDYVETFELIVFGDANGTSFSTGGSTGVAIGTDGALQAAIAKIWFLCTSEADGDWDGTYTDTGTAAAFLGVRLPNGRVIMSSAMTNT
jgi:hypothetical protein